MDPVNLVVCGDDSFGPVVKSADCRGGFDFTILFEEIFLAILPAALLLLLLPFRALRLLHRRIRVKRNGLYVCKLIAVGAYIGLQLALLVLSANPRIRTHVSVASAALSFVSGLSLALLSHLEHSKSIRPSFLINFYLLTTVFFDAARVRTQWLAGANDAAASALTASLAVKCFMLVLEAVEKRSLLLGLDRQFSTESTSGMMSRSSFWWLNSLLLSGFKRVLSVDALPAIHEKLNSEDLARTLQAAWNTCDQKRRHALAIACVLSLRWDIMAVFIPKFCYVALNLSQVYLNQSAVKYIEGANTMDWNNGYGLIAAFALVYIGLAVTQGWSSHLSYRIMSMMRGQLTSIVYNKMLTLPITGANESAAMTLMGTDVQTIASSFYMLLIDAVPSAIQLGVAVYLLYLQIGAICVAPVAIALISTGLSTVLAGHINSRQKRWYEAIQKRVNLTSHVLGSVRNVMMLGLSNLMFQDIRSMRENELERSKQYRKVQSFNISLVNLPSTFNTFLIFAAYAISAKIQGLDNFSVSQAISTLTALTLLDNPLGTLLYSIPPGWGALGCFARIQEFLLQESRTDVRSVDTSRSTCSVESQHDSQNFELQALASRSTMPAIHMQDSGFGWSDTSSDVVKEVTADIDSNSTLTIVVGPVGCGKSTLLKGLLGETPKSRGSLSIPSSDIAYCDQTPWIINGTIRENVVVASDFDDIWYQSVIQACALDIDLQRMTDGDKTVVGSQGMKLSGGQKQRLSIARAVYARKPLAILDDVLSGLDSITEELVFQRVFGPSGLFRQTNTTVILATHSVKRLPLADLILAIDETGRVVEQGTFSELNAAGNYIQSLQVKLGEQSHATESDQTSEDASDKPNSSIPTIATTGSEARKTGDWATYKYYTRALGLWPMVVFIGLVTINETFYGITNAWIKLWGSSNDNGGRQDLGYWLGLFALYILASSFAMVGAVAWLWIFVVPRSGKNLHESMLGAAIRAPLSFFAATETGILVNRFSQDLRLADLSLPGSLVNASFQLGSCIVTIVLNIVAVSYFAVILPLICAVLYFIQRFYLKTSRQLRLLEIEANAPLFSHFIETSNGLATIRAFGWTQQYVLTSRRVLDDAQKPYYLLLCIQRWLVLVLDLVVAGLVVVLMGMAVALRTRLDSGFLGLALVGMMGLSHSLTNLVQHYTTLETTLGAIARIKDFSENTPVEQLTGEDDCPDPAWPSHGALQFEEVSASYRKDTAPVLKDVSFSVSPGQKIGIVGRTGSGKSSSILTIMRMIDIVGGRIILDGVDLSTLTGSVIRERLNCLTQDSFLFPASIRRNADPLGQASDDAIVSALQKVGLWGVLQDKKVASASRTAPTTAESSDGAAAPAAVLDMSLDAELLSHGQRQLFCLARAMLRPGKVLILDEPTSSVDTRTDAQIQTIIRAEFRDHTVIMIAHRLSSLMDFDRVAVLDAGRLVEYGPPEELARRDGGTFARLYQRSVGSS